MTQPPQQPPFDPPSPYGQSPPPYGQAPYGAPPPYGPPGPQPRKTNGFAIASLIFGIIGFILFSVIFGIIALTQINKRGQKGKGLAIAGLVLSVLWILLFILIIAVASSADTERDASGEVVESGSVSVYNLRTGDCVTQVQAGEEVLNVPVVPCAELHNAEVFAVFELPDGDFPGNEAVAQQSEIGCSTRLAGYAPGAVNDPSLGLFYYSPTSDNWRLDDREVICLVSTPSPTTGSIRD